MKITNFQTLSEATIFASIAIQKALLRDIQEKGTASLILTGGQTVCPFLGKLATISLPWEKIGVLLSDERWVSVADNMSNEKQLNELFLNLLNTPPMYVSLRGEYASPAEAIFMLENNALIAQQSFTCALLSIGEDGHIASLFPEEMTQWSCQESSFFLSEAKGDRISLSHSLLQKVNKIFYFQKRQEIFLMIILRM